MRFSDALLSRIFFFILRFFLLLLRISTQGGTAHIYAIEKFSKVSAAVKSYRKFSSVLTFEKFPNRSAQHAFAPLPTPAGKLTIYNDCKSDVCICFPNFAMDSSTVIVYCTFQQQADFWESLSPRRPRCCRRDSHPPSSPHIHIHAHTHTHIHTYTHTYTRTHAHTHVHTHAQRPWQV